MLTSVRSLLAATMLAGFSLAATPAFAQDASAPTSDFTVSGNVAVVSDYRFRGVSLSGGDPAVQGGVTLSHSSGFYVGTWDQDSLGGDDNLYLYTNFDLGVPTTPVTVSAHLGYTDGVLAPPLLAGTVDDSGLDWSLGASVTVLNNLSLGASYVGVEGPSINGFTDDTVVGSLTLTF